jgi:hypothetical protein
MMTMMMLIRDYTATNTSMVHVVLTIDMVMLL